MATQPQGSKQSVDEELVSWANVMADSFGRSDCPTLAAFRGVSVSIHRLVPRWLTCVQYAEGKDHWRGMSHASSML